MGGVRAVDLLPDTDCVDWRCATLENWTLSIANDADLFGIANGDRSVLGGYLAANRCGAAATRRHPRAACGHSGQKRGRDSNNLAGFS